MPVFAEAIQRQEAVAPPSSADNRVSSEDSVAAAADTDAPATMVSVEKPLPHDISPRGPLAEIVKLVDSGVKESVLLAFVTNSVHTFNLSAEEIIYLNDIGVPASVVTAMIQRDQELKIGFASPPGPPLRVPETTPLTEEPTAPPPSDSSASYAVEAPLTPPEGAVDDSEEMFQDSLAPYGNWVDVAGYGRCWQPTVVVSNPGWQPYFNCGHWVYSDCGWYWLSDYSWGWAPFHYGNWFRHARLGWCWVPGHTWGPSWVSWRYDNDYCGWAPLPPGAAFSIGLGLTFHGHHVGERDDLGLRPDHYHFVAWNHFHDRQLQSHRLPPQVAQRAYDRSTIATRISGDGHTTINNALPVSRVMAATGRPIHTVSLREASEPTDGVGRAEHFDPGNRRLDVYRERPDLAAHRLDAANSLQSHPRPAQTPVWGTRSSGSPPVAAELTSRPGMRQNSSLILKGAQNSAMRETAPPNSLVVSGSRTPRQPSALPQPSTASAPSAPSEHNSEVPSSWARPASNPYDRTVVTEGRTATPTESRGDWRGTVTSSPQPSWFNGNASRPVASTAPAGGGTIGESRSYSSVPWSGGRELSRPTAAPNYVPQRAYSAPSQSSPAPTYSAPARVQAQSYTPPAVSSRPAPSAAPAAPAVSSSSGRSNNR